MATVLVSLTVPRASPFPSATLLSPSSSTSSTTVVTSLKLPPDFRGLRLSSSPVSSPSLRSVSSRPRFSRVVAESAVKLPSVTKDSWKSLVLESDVPVMVEFWAPWCGPCRIIQPVIDELSKEYAENLKVFKVNTDESPTIASDYGVRSIPTVLIFKNGEKKDAIIGAVPKTTLTNSIEKFL